MQYALLFFYWHYDDSSSSSGFPRRHALIPRVSVTVSSDIINVDPVFLASFIRLTISLLTALALLHSKDRHTGCGVHPIVSKHSFTVSRVIALLSSSLLHSAA